MAIEAWRRRGSRLSVEAGSGDPVGWLTAALEDGSVTMEALLGALATDCGVAVAASLPDAPEPGLAGWVSPEMARARQILPLACAGGLLELAVADPLDLETFDELAHRHGLRVEPRLADPRHLAAAIERFANPPRVPSRRREEEEEPDPRAAAGEVPALPPDLRIDGLERGGEGDGPIIRLVQRIIGEAVRQRASDIHLEPLEKRFRIRLRIDGKLREIENPPRHLHLPVISRLKLMAELSLAEKRRPQDGRIRVRAAGRDFDFRVSTLPSVFGETIVMRILDKEGLRLGLPELGMMADDETTFRRLVAQPDGIFLVTGPTGSGKSTTLYAALHHLNRPDRKIITVEDPVEYRITGINQVAVRREVGMDFAAALRAMLRQAPNIIMVGEIRDRETAGIAINASLTGHLVFSTLHTNDAPSAISRLVDLGAKPFLVAASLRAAMAQRLVRMICPHCTERYDPAEAELRALGLGREEMAGRALARGSGCAHCGGSGFFGRRGLFELLPIDATLERMIHERATLVALRRQARDAGMRTMREDGLRKVLAGWTTLAEVLAVTVAE
jgi:type IV pilus assembly protein PilB